MYILFVIVLFANQFTVDSVVLCDVVRVSGSYVENDEEEARGRHSFNFQGRIEESFVYNLSYRGADKSLARP